MDQKILDRVSMLKPGAVDAQVRHCSWWDLDVDDYQVYEAFRAEEFGLQPFDEERYDAILERIDEIEIRLAEATGQLTEDEQNALDDEWDELHDELDELEANRGVTSDCLVYPFDAQAIEKHTDVEGPGMSYWYPLPRNDYSTGELRWMAEAIVDLPLCLVYLDHEGKYGLALTGGGMDLSWEIAEAYIRLGYLPPLAFIDLPSFADLKLNERTQTVIAAFRETIKVMRKRLEWQADKLDRLEEALVDR